MGMEWARKALEGRLSIFAHDALAWALYGSRQLTEAADATTKGLATGVRGAHLLYHAAMIRLSLGDLPNVHAALQQTVAINPRHNPFHAHR